MTSPVVASIRLDDERAERDWHKGLRLGSVRPPNGLTQLRARLERGARERLRKEAPIQTTLPTVARELYAMVDDPNIGLPTIGRALGRDPVMAGRLLELANSTFYRGDRPTDSIDSAVLRVGTDCIRTAILMPVLEARLVRDPISAALWEHSRAVAATSPFLAALGGVSPDSAYLAGLLHESGKILIWQDGQGLASEAGGLLAHATASLHEDIGGRLMKRWSMPNAVAFAVANHHEPDPSKVEGEERLAHVIALADRLVTAEVEGEVLDVEEIPSVAALGIRPTPVRALRKRMANIIAESRVAAPA